MLRARVARAEAHLAQERATHRRELRHAARDLANAQVAPASSICVVRRHHVIFGT